MDNAVIDSLPLSPTDLAQQHGDRMTEVEYRLVWARTYLKAHGRLDNTSRDVWVLTPAGKDCTQLDAQDVVRFVRSRGRAHQGESGGHTAGTTKQADEHLDAEVSEVIAETQQEQLWQDRLMRVLPWARF